MAETLEEKKKRAAKILRRLKKTYPNARIALKYKTPIQLLAAVILSAQSTDKQVDKTTEKLFKKYKMVDDFAGANLKTFTKEVSSVNFYKNKAKFIINSAKKIKDEYNGKLPNDINELVKLPGVARKTANIVQFQVYGKTEGIAVDTHVKRVSRNLKLTNQKDPVKIEQDLMKLYPKKEWGRIEFYFQAYGRTAMPARGKPSISDPLEGLY
ncbi:MAG: endonuclease III [Candidatus Spechtbacterales bacterium]